MRVGINGLFWGMETTGSGQYTRHLLQAFAGLRPPVEGTLFLARRSGLAGVTPPPNWSVGALSTPFDRVADNLAKLWFEQIAFPRACHRAEVDLIHVPYFAAPLHSAARVVVTIHDLIPLVLREYRGSAWVQGYMRLVSQSARRAALVLTDSQASANDIERLLCIPRERIRVIYLAADVRYHPLSAAERQPIMERLGIRDRYILYLGGFDRRKNVTGLLRAYARAQADLGGVSLVIAGALPAADSAFAPDPRVTVARLGLGEVVRLTSRVAEEDKPALYGGALAFVFPSRYEGFGLPVLEALSCGAPVVVASGSSLEEIAGPGGVIVPAEDESALAAALVALARSPARREELAHQGLKHARRFSWQRTATETLDAYRSVLS